MCQCTPQFLERDFCGQGECKEPQSPEELLARQNAMLLNRFKDAPRAGFWGRATSRLLDETKILKAEIARLEGLFKGGGQDDFRIPAARLFADNKILRRDARKAQERLNIFTCNNCSAKEDCRWAWDLYNTNGDCLAEK